MRPVLRLACTPPSLRSSGIGGKLAALHQQEYATSGSPPKGDFPRHWNRPDVRGALFAGSGRLCVYCHHQQAEYNSLQVEHFRPKAAVEDDDTHGGYWWLAYEFSNYTLSCGECNGPAVKGTRFPLQPGTAARVRFENRHDLNSEASLLFHPCHDQFDAWFVVDQNGLLHPRVEASPDEHARLLAVRQFFRLNLRPELVRARANLWDNCLKLVSAGDYAALRSKAMLPESHTVVARTLLRTYAPAHLPLEIDEFDSLLQSLTQDLLIGLTLSSPDERLKKFLKELLYALATAWRFPKGRTSAEVEQHLVRWALRDRVKPFFDSLA